MGMELIKIVFKADFAASEAFSRVGLISYIKIKENALR